MKLQTLGDAPCFRRLERFVEAAAGLVGVEIIAMTPSLTILTSG